GAVSRGQFGQVNVASVTETVTVAASGNNAYMSQTPVAKQEARDNTTERDEKNNRPNNNKKRKHKDQRERTEREQPQQREPNQEQQPAQVHEEVAQLSRHE
ncbi:hypothetical protein, partial [Acinetobacter gyllenbergii]